MRRCLFSILVLITISADLEASCIDPATLVHSTVSITREFSEEERRAEPGTLGIRGTGWFLSPRLIVTAAHVADAMHLSAQDWKEIEVRERESKWSVPDAHRPRCRFACRENGGARVEVRDSRVPPPFRSGRSRSFRRSCVVSLAYPNNRLRFAQGRFVEFGADVRFVGAALLEMHDGNDRLVLDHGASGAPVLDCEGRVVAVVSTVITQTISFVSPARANLYCVADPQCCFNTRSSAEGLSSARLSVLARQSVLEHWANLSLLQCFP